MTAPDLSTLFEFLPIGAYRAALDGTTLHVNVALARMNGYVNEHDMHARLGLSLPNPYLNPEHRLRFQQELFGTGQVRNFEAQMVRHATGEVYWVRENAHLVRQPSGEALFYEGTVEDITEERMAKVALDERDALLRNLVQSIPAPVWLKNLDGDYLLCNQAFADFLNVAPEEVAGTRDSGWVDLEDAERYRSTDQLAVQQGRPVVLEEYFGRGGQRLHEVLKTPMVDEQGRPIGIIGMARDIQDQTDAAALLRETTEQLQLALTGADLGCWRYDLQAGGTQHVDDRTWRMVGLDPEQIPSDLEWSALIHPEDVPLVRAAMQQHLDGHTHIYEAEYRVRHREGRWIWVNSRGTLVQRSEDGLPLRMVGTVMDISGRKSAEARLRATQAELQATLNALPDVMFEFSASGIYRAVHCHDLSKLLHPPHQLIGRHVQEMLPREAAEVCLQALREALERGQSTGLQYRLQIGAKTLWFELSVVRKPTEADEEQRLLSITRDITERKTVTDAMAHLAYHDALTGLPNRRLLEDRLSRCIASSQRNHRWAAVMFIDLDRFKTLNDGYGHDVGDLLLQEVARRLQQCVREVDTVARLGGDEFVVLLQDLSDDSTIARSDAQALSLKILASLNQPYQLQGLQHQSSPSIGVRMFRGDSVAHTQILQQADAAMYAAKADGRNGVRFHKE